MKAVHGATKATTRTSGRICLTTPAIPEMSPPPPSGTTIVWRPKTLTPVASDDATTLFKLIDALDDDDDVQNVFTNADFSDEDLARLAG